LLQRKADVNAPQVDGTTALHWAVRLDDLDTAELLIRAGANVSAANRAGATPMRLAALNGNAAMVEKIIKAGADWPQNTNATRAAGPSFVRVPRGGKSAFERCLKSVKKCVRLESTQYPAVQLDRSWQVHDCVVCEHLNVALIPLNRHLCLDRRGAAGEEQRIDGFAR
jgi:ankyrin repeat protein